MLVAFSRIVSKKNRLGAPILPVSIIGSHLGPSAPTLAPRSRPPPADLSLPRTSPASHFFVPSQLKPSRGFCRRERSFFAPASVCFLHGLGQHGRGARPSVPPFYTSLFSTFLGLSSDQMINLANGLPFSAITRGNFIADRIVLGTGARVPLRITQLVLRVSPPSCFSSLCFDLCLLRLL